MNIKYQNYWKCIVPDGQQGKAKIETFSVGESASFLSTINRSYVPQGTYKRLYVSGKLMMSDTPKEFRDHIPFFHKARGRVLINGLGLGCCLNVILNCPDIIHVTVIEKSQDVIDLVSPSFPQVEIICADAMIWRPTKGLKYDAVWHDIWPDICTDNLKDMHKLHRSYGRRSDWQGSWSRDEIEYLKHKESRFAW